MMKNFYMLLIGFIVLLQPSIAKSQQNPSEGTYIGIKVGGTQVNSKGHFETGPPIVQQDRIDYTYNDIETYLIELAIGHGHYGYVHEKMFTGGEVFIQYSPIDEAQSSEVFDISFNRNIIAGIKGLLGALVLDSALLSMSAGLQYSNHVYGAEYKPGITGWEDHDFLGTSAGLHYRRSIFGDKLLSIEYEFSHYSMYQSLKDGAKSAQEETARALKVGVLFGL